MSSSAVSPLDGSIRMSIGPFAAEAHPARRRRRAAASSRRGRRRARRPAAMPSDASASTSVAERRLHERDAIAEAREALARGRERDVVAVERDRRAPSAWPRGCPRCGRRRRPSRRRRHAARARARARRTTSARMTVSWTNAGTSISSPVSSLQTHSAALLGGAGPAARAAPCPLIARAPRGARRSARALLPSLRSASSTAPRPRARRTCRCRPRARPS